MSLTSFTPLFLCFGLLTEVQANPLMELGVSVGTKKQSIIDRPSANCNPEKEYVRIFGGQSKGGDVVVCDLTSSYPRNSNGVSPLKVKVAFFKPYQEVGEVQVMYWSNFKDIMKTMPPASYVLDHSTESPLARRAEAYWYSGDVVTHLECKRGCIISSAKDTTAIKRLKLLQHKYAEEESKKQQKNKKVMDAFNAK